MANYYHKTIIIVVLFLLTSCKAEYFTAKTLLIDNNVQADSSLYPSIEPYQKQMKVAMDEVIGVAEDDLIKEKPEGKLGNYVADLTLNRALLFEFIKLPQEQTFCLLNHGGLRAPFSKGEITKGNVFEVMPFDNEIVVLKLSGTKVAELIKYVINSGGHPIAGITIDEQKDGYKTLIYNQAFDSTQTYYVVTSDYLANGGDKMIFFLNPIEAYKSGVLLRDAIMDEIQSTKGAIKSKIDGRIKLQENE